MKKKSRAILIFSGFNPRAVVAFLRTLERHKVPYGIIAKSSGDPIYETKYKDRVVACRTTAALDLEDIQVQIKMAKKNLPADAYDIMPSTEALNRFIIENEQLFGEINCSMPVVNRNLYEQISDKEPFSALCAENDILIPKEFKKYAEVLVPFVAKPKKYLAGDGKSYSPVLVLDQTTKIMFESQFNTDDFYFQEFVDGISYYLLYYFYKNGNVSKYSQQNLVQQPDGKSIIAAVSSDYHMRDISSSFEELFRKVNYFGLVMVEVRVRNSQHYMIEANPRFWGPSQLMVDSGINLFEDMLFDLGYISVPKICENVELTRYFWGSGFAKTEESYDKLAYINYSREKFISELEIWEESDIYNRPDTHKIFEAERKEAV